MLLTWGNNFHCNSLTPTLRQTGVKPGDELQGISWMLGAKEKVDACPILNYYVQRQYCKIQDQRGFQIVEQSTSLSNILNRTHASAIFIITILMLSENDSNISYTFILDHQVKFGQAIFLAGSCLSLGQWYTSKAIRMECTQQKYWIVSATIPLDTMIQYKYFVAPYRSKGHELCQTDIQWLGNRNQRVLVPTVHRSRFLGAGELSVMSFNLRYENEVDKGQQSWESRKGKCCATILEQLPDLLGVQEANIRMVKYILDKIGHLYRYFGKPRDLKQGESSGIFIRKDKFLVREDGYIWINETKTPGLRGFGAPFHRYYTYLVLQPVAQDGSLIMHVNTHLDNEVGLARLMGVKYMAATIEEKFTKYAPALQNVFLTGDFNTSDSDPIFKSLVVHSQKMQSLRYMLPDHFSDHEETFNNFEPRPGKSESELTKNLVIIDHIFTRLRGYVPVSLAVLREKRVSDHYPIVGYFMIRQE